MRLKSSYAAAESGDDAGRDSLSIHAYTDVSESLKKQFLRDGRTYLLAVARTLQPHRFASLGVQSNPAGVAVSGDVWFKAWSDARQQGVSLALSGTTLTVDRADRLASIANELSQRELRGAGKHAHVDFKRGLNVWLSANLDSNDVAQQVLAMLEVVHLDHAPKPQLTLFDTATADAAMRLQSQPLWPTYICPISAQPASARSASPDSAQSASSSSGCV